jgi:hypothetical protein
MVQRWLQSTSVLLSLIGVQDISVEAHRAMTEDATIGVRVGRTLFYLHDAQTALSFAQHWTGMRRRSAALRREADAAIVAPMPGVRDPMTVIDIRDAPPMFGRLETLSGGRGYLRTGFGRVVLDVWDLGAYSSVTRAFVDAAQMRAEAFPAATAQDQRQASWLAASRASMAFAPQQAARRAAGQSKAAAVGRSTSTPRLEMGGPS